LHCTPYESATKERFGQFNEEIHNTSIVRFKSEYYAVQKEIIT